MSKEAPDAKKVLIGGISGGVGRAAARKFYSQGWRVGGFARTRGKLDLLAKEMDGLEVWEADATDPDAMAAIFKMASEKLGGLDAYVHCVGSVLLKAAHLTSPAEWRETLGKNLDSSFYALRAAIPIFQQTQGGVLLFCSSVAARTGLANHEAIAAAKGGIEALVRSAASTYAPRRIRVNAVALGLIETGATQAILGNPQGRSISEQMHPLGRVGRAEEAASLLAWLASDEAEWVTGHVYALDGGLGAITPRPKIARG